MSFFRNNPSRENFSLPCRKLTKFITSQLHSWKVWKGKNRLNLPTKVSIMKCRSKVIAHQSNLLSIERTTSLEMLKKNPYYATCGYIPIPIYSSFFIYFIDFNDEAYFLSNTTYCLFVAKCTKL